MDRETVAPSGGPLARLFHLVFALPSGHGPQSEPRGGGSRALRRSADRCWPRKPLPRSWRAPGAARPDGSASGRQLPAEDARGGPPCVILSCGLSCARAHSRRIRVALCRAPFPPSHGAPAAADRCARPTPVGRNRRGHGPVTAFATRYSRLSRPYRVRGVGSKPLETPRLLNRLFQARMTVRCQTRGEQIDNRNRGREGHQQNASSGLVFKSGARQCDWHDRTSHLKLAYDQFD